MDVKELQPKQANVEITLDVIEVGTVREFQKFGKAGRVATALAKDKIGDKINLTLWNDDIEKIKAGDTIKLTNGYVNEWQGELQLSTGRLGKLEIINKSKTDDDKDVKVYRNYPAKEDEKMLSEELDDFSKDVDEEPVDEI